MRYAEYDRHLEYALKGASDSRSNIRKLAANVGDPKIAARWARLDKRLTSILEEARKLRDAANR